MACCGQKREAVAAAAGRTTRSNPSAGVATRPPASPQAAAKTFTSPGAAAGQNGDTTVTLRYRFRSAVVVEGAATGARYHFAGGGSMQAVERRDAEALIATGLFERIWG